MRPFAIVTAAALVFAAQAAAAECSDGIAQVRSEVKGATVGQQQKDRISSLLDLAAEQGKAGNEKECEKLVSDAKQTLDMSKKVNKSPG